ncbi:MAG: peptide chain release factor N(5)-glutamine methyltransferase [Sphingomonas sp.]
MAETARAAIGRAARQFADFSQSPVLDAELLMAHAMACTRETLLLARLDEPAPEGFAALVARRLTHEPIAYITGSRAFWTVEIGVGPGVLVPRADSETLIEAAIAHFKHQPPATIVDLGTGPGTLLLAALAAWPDAFGLGIDRSPMAIALARANATRNGLERRAHFVVGDWATAVSAPFDLVLANPPYIAEGAVLPREVWDHEPPEALFAGPDGLADFAQIVPQLRALVAPGGAAIVEIGVAQAAPVTRFFEANGFVAMVRHDLAGHARAVVAVATSPIRLARCGT